MGKKIYKNKFKQDVVFPETQIDIYTESVIGSKHKTIAVTPVGSGGTVPPPPPPPTNI